MKKLYFYLTLIILSFGCSNSDLDENNLNSTLQKDITIIAKENNQYYQIDVLNNSKNIITTNLSETLGIEYPYLVLNTSPSLISFFKMAGNSFPVFQKNIITSETYIRNQFCDLDSQEGRNFPTNSDKKLILFTYEYNENSISNADIINNFIRIYDKQTENCVKLLIGSGELYSRKSTIVIGENIYVYYTNKERKPEIVKINLITNKIEEELIFDNIFRATISDNELHIFSNGEHEIYNTLNFEMISKSSLNLNNLLGYPGLFETSFKDNEMLIDLPYAQPSPVEYGPATIDLTTGEIIKGLENNLLDVWRDLGDHLKASVGITTYSVDLKSNLIVIGFEKISQYNKSGGVVYSNFKGEILKIVELEFIPNKIIIR